MSDFQLFIPLTKVDLEKREVWGIGAVEQVDKTGKEIFDYGSSKPRIQKWSDDFLARTSELAKTAGEDVISRGNIREMHKDIAAGKVIALNFNDDAKQVELGTHVVDDSTWEKVQKGVLTGFSIGGSYGKTWKDGVYKRYEALPAEFSYVDNPCIPDATFTVIKADGATELRKFAAPPDPKAVISENLGKLAKSFAGVKNYPADANWYVMQEAWDINSACAVLGALASLVSSENSQASDEGPDVALLGSTMQQIIQFITGEVAEMLEAATQTADIMQMALKLGGLAKAGARHNAIDNALVQDIHDRSSALGADCAMPQEAEKAMNAEDLKKVQDLIDATLNGDALKKVIVEAVAAAEPLQKMAGASTEQATALAKVVTQNEELSKKVDGAGEQLTDLEKRLKVVEDQPDPRMPVRLNIATREGAAPVEKQAVVADLEKVLATPGISDQTRAEVGKLLALNEMTKTYQAGPQRIGR